MKTLFFTQIHAIPSLIHQKSIHFFTVSVHYDKYIHETIGNQRTPH